MLRSSSITAAGLGLALLLSSSGSLAQQTSPADASAPPTHTAPSGTVQAAGLAEPARGEHPTESKVEVAPSSPATSAANDHAEPPTTPAPEQTPAAAAPSPPQGATAPVREPTPTDSGAPVRFVESSGLHVPLFVRKGVRWVPVCTSPCSFPAPDGPRDYAAPKQGATGGYRTAAKALWLGNGDGLQADFRDRKLVRKTGLSILLVGLALLPFIPVTHDAKHRTAARAGLFVPSAALSLSGLIMLLMKDRVELKRCAGCNSTGLRAP